jgi:putative transcriptional regulator
LDDVAPVLERGELLGRVRRRTARVVGNNLNYVKAIRARLGLSQGAFAARFRLSLRTVQDWEQGRYEPDQIARNYLAVVAAHPERVSKTVLDMQAGRAAGSRPRRKRA